LLLSCKATSASEGTARGTGKTDPESPGDVYAVPDRGVSGPLAVLIRSSEPFSGVTANTTVEGRPANLSAGDQGQAGIQWNLADGGSAALYGRDLSDADLHALASAIDAGTPPPIGLTSIGTTTEATWARSTCDDPQGGQSTEVEAIHGTAASRYARVIAEPPAYRWDAGDTTFLFFGPGGEPTSLPEVRQATDEEWSRLLQDGVPALEDDALPAATVASVTATTFDEEVLRSDLPVIVEFWAPWCGPCRSVTPSVERIAMERQGSYRVVRVNIDEAPLIAERYEVEGIPQVGLFRDGGLDRKARGTGSLEEIEAALGLS
jgi:thioredoxin 1